MLSVDEEARRRFESDWLNHETKSISIRHYLPRPDAQSYLGTLEELVCIDLEFRWQHGASSAETAEQTATAHDSLQPTRVEDYLREFPDLDQPEIVARLVEQEVIARVGAGFVVEPDEYQSRFPDIKLDQSLFDAGQTRVSPSDSPVTTQTVTDFPKQFGSYILTERIGRGGMGSVYRADQPAAGREVAIKIADLTSPSAYARQAVTERFETEAHAAARIVHDHLVPIYDVGSVDGQPYYAMQLVQGGDLSSLTRESTLPDRVAARYLSQISSGVSAAHSAGMLHRDIKPQNILIDQATDRAMLTDFGLARWQSTDSSLTQAGQILGTPSYMPPEQIRDSSQIDARADVYSLGATLYQAVTGRAPFKAQSVNETLQQVTSGEPVQPKRLNPGLSADLNTIILKCLEKSPEARYQSAAELAEELQRFLEGRPILARPQSLTSKTIKWTRRNPALAAASAVAIAGLLATAVVSAYGWSRTSYLLDRRLEADAITLETLDRGFSEVLEEPVLGVPDARPVRDYLVELTLDGYRRHISGADDVQRGSLGHADALSKAARLARELDSDSNESQRLLEEARSICENLESYRGGQSQSAGEVEHLRIYSDVLIQLGVLDVASESLEAAKAKFEQAERLRRRWLDKVRGSSNEVEATRKLANAMMNQGIVLRRLEQFGEAEAKQWNAQTLRNEHLHAGNRDFRLRFDTAKANNNLAVLAATEGDYVEALDRCTQAAGLFEELGAEQANDVRIWRGLADVLLLQADVLIQSDASLARGTSTHREGAVDSLMDALNILDNLAQTSLNHPESALEYLESGRAALFLCWEVGSQDPESVDYSQLQVHWANLAEKLNVLLHRELGAADVRDRAELLQVQFLLIKSSLWDSIEETLPTLDQAAEIARKLAKSGRASADAAKIELERISFQRQQFAEGN